MALRVTTRIGLLAGKFREGGVDARDGAWSNVDPTDPRVRKTLLKYVPSHLRLADGQSAELAAAELELAGGRLRDLHPGKSAGVKPAAAAPASSPKAKPTPSPTPGISSAEPTAKK